MDLPDRIDYLVIGHICRDLTPNGFTIGGTAAYSAATARVLGCRTAVVTSYSASENWQDQLPGISIHLVPSKATTTFENRYEAAGRVQSIHAVAGEIGMEDVPKSWRRANIVHLGPVANEVDPGLITIFSNSIVGLTPQGWMRGWDDSGKVRARQLENPEQLLPLAAVTFVSNEDLETPAIVDQFRRLSRVLVITLGADGSTVFFDDEVRTIAAPRVPVEDVTGAGDIYSTAFLVRLHQTGGDPWEAARFANNVAAKSVTTSGLANKMRVLEEHIAIEGPQ